MKIIEVRDGFIKFEADEKVCLSGFVQANGTEKTYVAQVIQIKDVQEKRIAYAKILFLYNDGLVDYDKTTPSLESEINHFPFSKFADTIIAAHPVVTGKTLKSYEDIVVDASAFDKKTIVSTDDKNSESIILKNFIGEFNKAGKNVIIIDALGRVDAMKYIAGVDFKLPLNTSTLNFIYEECINDATEESKSLIMDIFQELSDYSSTVPFVPFETLKNIVDDMVDNSHVFKLLVLKNKLSKFARMGYFASTKEEVNKLGLILKSRSAILDISKLDTLFQNRYLNFIYETLGETSKTQVIAELSNTVSQKSLKNIITNESIPTLFVTHSKFKYLNDIKNLFNNYIIVPSDNNNVIFSTYETFLKSMKEDSYLIAGEFTNYVPLVSELADFSQFAVQQPQEEICLENEPEEISEEPAEDSVNENEENKNQFSGEELLKSLNEFDENTADGEDVVSERPEVMNMFGSDEEDISDDSAVEIEEVQLPEINEEEPIIEKSEIQDAEVIELAATDDAANVSEEETTFTEDYSTVEHQSNLIIEHDIDLPEDEEVEAENSKYEEIPITESEGIEIAEQIDSAEEDLQSAEPHENAEFIQENTLQEENAIEIDESIDLDLDSELGDISSVENEEIQEISDEGGEPVELEQAQEVIPISEENDEDYGLEEIQELDSADTTSADIIIDINDEETDEISDELDEEIARDVDSVYTKTKDDSLSDSDLDLIDELNSDEEMSLEEVSANDNVLEELSDDSDEIMEPPTIELKELENDEKQEILETRDSSTPIVPVYDADIPQEDMVMSDPIQQGDSVIHAKYGTGVVEKMIKYGSKTLFSINFDNIGRRLLDPTLTEIKKN